jgi:hypothetical protein
MYNACAVKNLMIDKHYFMKIWNSEDKYNSAWTFFNVFRDTYKKHRLYNIGFEKDPRGFGDILRYEMRKKQNVIMNLNMTASKRKIVGELCNCLGMTHSTDNKTVVNVEQMQSACDYIKKNNNEITSIYKSMRKECNSEGIKPWKMLLNKILLDWSGSNISPNEVKRKVPVSYKVKSMYDNYNSVVCHSTEAKLSEYVRQAVAGTDGDDDENEVFQVNSGLFDYTDEDGNVF